jgi:hypothetical protein
VNYSVGDQLFVHSHDLMASIPGRDDPLDERLACTDYLDRREASRQRGATPSGALRAQSAIAAAVVLASVVKSPKELEVEQSLAAANKTIDRLLAFVHTRAASIGAARLEAIVSVLCDTARREFPGLLSLVVVVADEGDRETEACHRITIRAFVPDSITTQESTRAVKAVHRALAEMSEYDELRAITLIVQPERIKAS